MVKRNNVIFFLALLIGLGLLNYPFMSQWVNRQNQTKVIYNYESSSGDVSAGKKKEILAQARLYNEELAEKQITLSDGFSGDICRDDRYGELLNPFGDGMMGWIEIPSIDVRLPIYHGTTSDVLQKGVGHLYHSSLPVGGSDTHAVLSAHTGLATKTFFTDLDQVRCGEKFYLYIFDEVLAYEVTETVVVLPEDTSRLEIVEGQDLVTLVTCTPYGINSHRLLVRGSRVNYEPEEKTEEESFLSREGGMWLWGRRVFILSLVALTGGGILLLKPVNKGRRQKNEQ